MSLLRYLPRAMIGASFISSGVSTLRATADTGPPTDADGEPFGADGQSPDDEQVQKAAAAVKVAAGSLLLLNKLPRLSALALAGTLAPGMAAQPFWEMDGDRRQQAMQQFMRHLGMAGGLLITAMDTQGRPGLAWRAGHAVEHAGTQIAHTRREAKHAAKAAAQAAKASGAATAAGAAATLRERRREAKAAARAAKAAGRGVRRAGRGVGRGAAGVGRTARRAATAVLPG